ncbi:MAG: hypothetical protein CSB47_08000 [Proteobacteria bacterium]|nr:MAG: hypothetical protein CSB47_08000 [Pseudomonadota bacterium]
MRLLIDMGNSRLKSARYANAQLDQFVSRPYGDSTPIDCLKAFIRGQSELVSVTLVSVLGDAFQTEVKAYCQKEGIHLIWAASSATAHGIRSAYHTPENLGSDRFVALVGARKLFPEQYCIVVDCGTATTVDALTSDGVFCGGVIIPGLQLWGDSLMSRANQLNAHEMNHPTVFAKDTPQAIGSGSVYGLVGAIEGLCQRMEVQFRRDAGVDIPVVRLLCGGDAHLIAAHTRLSFEVVPHLVLTGLTEFTE